jgi:radical SAM superfamily enzyme YgiQ (UPF0313 family)
MKVAGIYWYDTVLDPKIQHAVSEPYGLERILAIAEQKGHETELFLPIMIKERITTNLSEQEIINNIIRYEPDLVCFSLYTCQYPAGKRIAAEIKNHNPKTITIAGNRYPSFMMQTEKFTFKEPFDFIVFNEGEETFNELLEEIEKEKDNERDNNRNNQNGNEYNQIKGLAFKHHETTVLTNPRPRIRNIDSFPPAKRFEIVLQQSYQGISIPSLSSNPHYALMEYSRGCYGECSFCDNSQVWGKTLTFREPKKVVEELQELKQKGADMVYFIDLNFTAVPSKARELCQEMLKSNLNLSWYCMSNIETADGQKELLHLMKKAGCYKIAWGIESTNNASLHQMNKKISGKTLRAEQAQLVLESSFQAGMLNQGYYIIGFPWETAESIARDAQELKHLPLHQLNVGIFTPIPLSNLFHQGLELDSDLEKHDRNHLVYRHQTLNHQTLKFLQEKMHREFYDSPEYLKRVRTSCEIDFRFQKAFNDYFQFLGKEMKI